MEILCCNRVNIGIFMENGKENGSYYIIVGYILHMLKHTLHQQRK